MQPDFIKIQYFIVSIIFCLRPLHLLEWFERHCNKTAIAEIKLICQNTYHGGGNNGTCGIGNIWVFDTVYTFNSD
jgi:hypothetical protein